ncbi:hypothetical protein CHS0354_033683 [Potamilus streckersoni]|uniref:Ankyrin repeat protein n=1 Tax=Potamilus streckersoni TaxID=2493646 RepID=A0AAE0VNA5_9BIVA|nr:hypothetical protein CHS0354_033683 [Potamilus streckersoni]
MGSENLNFDTEFSSTGIFQGILERNPEKVLHHIKQGENVHQICSKTGMGYLHLIMTAAYPITETKYVPIIYQLSNANIFLDHQDVDGRSPLHLSIKGMLLELMVALIKCGATCSIEDDEHLISKYGGFTECETLERYRKFAPGYWIPVAENKAFKVNILVKSWCRINISRNEKTLVEFAKEKSADEKITKMLLDNESTIEFAHATIAGDEDKMKSLIDHFNIDLTTKDLSHRESYFEPYFPLSLYGAAIKYGHKHILYMLKNVENIKITEPAITHYSEDSSDRSQSAVCIIL